MNRGRTGATDLQNPRLLPSTVRELQFLEDAIVTHGRKGTPVNVEIESDRHLGLPPMTWNLRGKSSEKTSRKKMETKIVNAANNRMARRVGRNGET